jgi:maleate isomerase
VVAALAHLGVKRIALGTPYDPASTAKTQALLQEYGIEVVSQGQLEGVGNIYDETAARARELARRVDKPEAQAVYLSGLGMPTIAGLAAMEKDLGKPVISAAAAMMWHPMRLAGERAPVPGFGRLLANVL